MEEIVLQYNSGSVYAKRDSAAKELLCAVSFEVSAGESLALIGETGSGKTMIAQSILGVLPRNVYMQDGEIRFLSRPLPSGRRLRALLGRDIVYIPQSGHVYIDPSRTVRQHMAGNLRRIGVSGAAQRAEMLRLLALSGFDAPEDVLNKYPFQLSGGMAQRVTVALSLCSRARLLIADEPTNGLDAGSKRQTLSLLNALFPDAAKLIITHDISVAAACGRILVLCGGRMLEAGAADEVLSAPRHPYTKALLGALVENGMQETPVLREETGLCPFYRRCPRAAERCRAEMTHKTAPGREWWCCAE